MQSWLLLALNWTVGLSTRVVWRAHHHLRHPVVVRQWPIIYEPACHRVLVLQTSDVKATALSRQRLLMRSSSKLLNRCIRSFSFNFILPSAYLELHTNELGLYMYVHLHIWAFSLYFTSVAFKINDSGHCWSFRCRLALRNSPLLKRSVKERIRYRNRSRSSPMRSFLTVVHLHPLALSTYKRLYPSSVSPFILFPLLLHSILTWLVLLLH